MDLRRVDRKIIDRWIDENGPNGLSKLAVAAGVSASTIEMSRRGSVPRRSITRQRLCKAIGVNEEALFPPADTGSDRAS